MKHPTLILSDENTTLRYQEDGILVTPSNPDAPIYVSPSLMKAFVTMLETMVPSEGPPPVEESRKWFSILFSPVKRSPLAKSGSPDKWVQHVQLVLGPQNFDDAAAAVFTGSSAQKFFCVSPETANDARLSLTKMGIPVEIREASEEDFGEEPELVTTLKKTAARAARACQNSALKAKEAREILNAKLEKAKAANS